MDTERTREGVRLPMIDDGQPVLDRRGFLARSAVLAAVAALAGSCKTAPFGLQLDRTVTVRLADYPELSQVGGVAVLQGVNVPIAMVNLGPNQYVALSLICPHQGGSISWNGSDFMCSVHGATFADDGHWIGGQPTTNMYEYKTSYDSVAGSVTVSP